MLWPHASTQMGATVRLGAVAGLGVLFSFVARQYGVPAAALVLLLIPCVIFILPLAIGHAVRSFSGLTRQLAWWHGLWLLLFLSGIVFRMRDVQAIRVVPVDLWASLRIALVCLAALVLVARLVGLQYGDWVHSSFRGLVGAMAAYSVVCVISTAWSVYPAWTLYKSLEYSVDVALLAAILAAVRSAHSYKTLFDLTWVFYGLLLISVCLGALAWPREAVLHGVGTVGVQLQGVLPAVSANGVGELSATLALVSLIRLFVRPQGRCSWAWYSVVLAAGLVTLVLSQTRSAWVGFLLGLVMILLICKHFATMALLIAFSLPICFTSLPRTISAAFVRGQSPELLYSLSSRLDFWEFGWQKFLQQPLTGYGAYAGGRFTVLEEMGYTSTSSVHNTYVEIIMGTGWWGLVPVLLALLGAWWILVQALRKLPLASLEYQLALEAAGLLAIVTVRSFFTSHLIWHPSLVFLLVLGYAEFLRRRKYRACFAVEPARPVGWE